MIAQPAVVAENLVVHICSTAAPSPSLLLHFDSTSIWLQLEQIQFILVTANDLTQVPHDDFLGEIPRHTAHSPPFAMRYLQCLLPSVHP